MKFTETNCCIPLASSFLKNKKEYFEAEEVLAGEFKVLELLDYNIHKDTNAYTLALNFLRHGIIKEERREVLNKFYSKTEEIVKFFLFDVRALDFSNIEIAVAALLLAGNQFNLTNMIKQNLSDVYNIDASNSFLAFTVIKK